MDVDVAACSYSLRAGSRNTTHNLIHVHEETVRTPPSLSFILTLQQEQIGGGGGHRGETFRCVLLRNTHTQKHTHTEEIQSLKYDRVTLTRTIHFLLFLPHSSPVFPSSPLLPPSLVSCPSWCFLWGGKLFHETGVNTSSSFVSAYACVYVTCRPTVIFAQLVAIVTAVSGSATLSQTNKQKKSKNNNTGNASVHRQVVSVC